MTDLKTKRRPRRIAADEAHAWARNLKLGNPYAKLLLSMLTLYVNGEGSCFVSIAQLAEDCELAENTVRRRLTFLEHIGALAKFPQWQDEHGRRNLEGRGRRTTDDIRLLLSADTDEIEAKAAGNAEPDHEDNSAGRGAPGEPLNSSEDIHRGSLGVHLPSHCGQGLDSLNHEPEDSPQPPKGGDGEPIAEVLEDQAWPGSEMWFDFEEAWPDPIMRVSTCRGLWSALRDDERLRAIAAARGYAIWRKQQRRPPNYSAQTFLREPDGWPSFAKHAPPEPGSSAPQPRLIGAASREGKAIITLYEIAVTPPPYSEDRLSILVTAAEIGPQVLALADVPPWREWIFTENANQSGAWAQLMRPIIGKTPRMTDRGVRVPWLWPPRVDGSIPKPDSISDQDAEELSKTATGH